MWRLHLLSSCCELSEVSNKRKKSVPKLHQSWSFRNKNSHRVKSCREIRGLGVDGSHTEQEGKLPEPKLAPGFYLPLGFITELPGRPPSPSLHSSLFLFLCKLWTHERDRRWFGSSKSSSSCIFMRLAGARFRAEKTHGSEAVEAFSNRNCP